MSLPNAPVVPQEARRESRTISNPDLLMCLGDRTAYYDLYIKLTNRAIEAYVKAGRRKFALRLHGSLAALDVLVKTLSSSTRLTVPTYSHRDRFKSALQTYSSLPAHYSPHRWTSLESYMLSQAIDIYSWSGIDRDKQWITIALSYLKSYSGGGSKGEPLIAHMDSSTYITDLVDTLKAVVGRLSERLSPCSFGPVRFLISSADSAFTYSEHPAITIRLLDATNEICLSLFGRNSEKLQFSAQVTSLEPGPSTFKLFCPVRVLERCPISRDLRE